MKLTFGFQKRYFFLMLILLMIEVIIGFDFHDKLIRPYGGDFIVVIFLYCCIKSFIQADVLKTAVGILIFAYLVEVSQYFHLVRILALQNNKPALILLGDSFSFNDLIAYTLGIALVLLLENLKRSLQNF
ncbi:MAG TPA: DUF2809 domain-containing protein [Mucilaginibacter sp.]|nr:DUF2809 domain-containing protein [Mucilaginibacter sp.]